MTRRYYSTVYDSVVQNNVGNTLIEKGKSLEDLRKYYKTLIKLDLLLHGTLVLTDSQFFDGAYFHALAGDGFVSKEFDEFYQFINTYNESFKFIEVKCRREKNHEDTLYQMLSNPSFIISAAGNNSTFFRHAIDNATKEITANNGEKNIRNLTDVALTYINSDFRDVFQQYQYRLMRLNEFVYTPSARIKTYWTTEIPNQSRSENPFRYYFSNNLRSYINRVNQLQDDILSGFRNELLVILNRSQFDRSDVVPCFDKFKQLRGLPPAMHNKILLLESEFFQIYNTSIAQHHGCNLYHKSDLKNNYKYSLTSEPYDIPISAGLFDSLGEETWLEFSKTLNHPEIKKHYKYWHECQENNSLYALEKYINTINNVYKGKAIKNTIENLKACNTVSSALSAIIAAITIVAPAITAILPSTIETFKLPANVTSIIGVVLLTIVNRNDRAIRLILDSHNNVKSIKEYESLTSNLDYPVD